MMVVPGLIKICFAVLLPGSQSGILAVIYYHFTQEYSHVCPSTLSSSPLQHPAAGGRSCCRSDSLQLHELCRAYRAQVVPDCKRQKYQRRPDRAAFFREYCVVMAARISACSALRHAPYRRLFRPEPACVQVRRGGRWQWHSPGRRPD